MAWVLTQPDEDGVSIGRVELFEVVHEYTGGADAGKYCLPLLNANGRIPSNMVEAGAGSGDMEKSVYDPNDDGKVTSAVNADAVPWSGVTGKPTEFTPSSHSHLLANITDAGGLASLDAVTTGEIDSTGATAGHVLKADGAGGVTFGAVALTFATAKCSADVTMTNANQFYTATGATVDLTAGTWLLLGHITMGRTATTLIRYTARLWNSTDAVALAGGQMSQPSQNPHYVTIPLTAVAVVASGTKTVAIQGCATTGACVIKTTPADNGATLTNMATQIHAIKIV